MSTKPKEKFSALVVEDDPISSALVAQAVQMGLPETLVLAARTLGEARQLIDHYTFHCFILDIMLPDGSGIDLLHEVTVRNPDAGVIVTTGTQLPEYRDQAQAFGVLNFLEKPIDLKILINIVRSCREQFLRQRAAAGTGDTTFFSASLIRLTPLDVIQLKCLGQATATLEFVSRRQGKARIYIKTGEIIHAETETQHGTAALNEVVSWRGGQVNEVRDAPEPPHTIQGDWQNLLMHAVQWADEKRDEETRIPPL